MYDIKRWLPAEDALVRRVCNELDSYVVRERMVLKVWFVKTNPAMGEVLRRRVDLYIILTHFMHSWFPTVGQAIYGWDYK